MRTLIRILVLALLPLAAGAEEIYRSTDEDGNPLFTDEPPSDDAEPVELDPLTTVPGPDTGNGGIEEAQGGEGADGSAGQQGPVYRALTVTYPPADQAVRHNGGLVPVRVALEPEGTGLREGHQVEVMLDGEVRGRGASLQVTLSAVSRGPHTVRARVVDASGRPVISSPPVDFMLLRAALGNE